MAEKKSTTKAKATAKVAKPAAKASVKSSKTAATKKVVAPQESKPKAVASKKTVVAKAAAAPKAKSELRTVEFGCYSPASGIVEVAGDFNGWVPAKNPMKKGADGYWSTKIKLQPGRYTYKFVYDGVAWELDRQAPAMADLDGHLNSVIDVD